MSKQIIPSGIHGKYLLTDFSLLNGERIRLRLVYRKYGQEVREGIFSKEMPDYDIIANSHHLAHYKIFGGIELVIQETLRRNKKETIRLMRRVYSLRNIKKAWLLDDETLES